ncbi:MAG: PilZ domain-containing protein [Deltaproteobacteria bacterium]|nr:PilZ domain-containing protein [Deltaproteobacteria bacterium]MBW2448506.1 PilZ domain-containing protein [Deltaproteobacteria bacterium]
MSESDDRQFRRNPAKLEVKITSELGSCIRGSVQDVSVAGLFVVTNERLPVGTLCELEVEVLSGEDEGPIEATGRVAHVEPDGIGIEITDLDLESYDELRRLAGYSEPSDN